MRRLRLVLNHEIFSRISTLLMPVVCAIFVCSIICPVQSWAQWTELQELTALNGGAYAYLGWSVAMDGNTLVVGSPEESLPSGTPGEAYVFVQNGGTWTQQAVLTESDRVQVDTFGESLAISGNTIVVGDYTLEKAYVFVRNGGTWTQQAELTASDGMAGDWFGYSVAISGNTILVGAPCYTAAYPPCVTGHAYVFGESGGTWTQQAELIAADSQQDNQFGFSVAFDGSTVVVGAIFVKVGSSTYGATYVFSETGGTWTQQAKLTASDGAPGDQFGYGVAVNGGTVAATSGGSGAVHVFVQNGGTWTQQAELTDPSFGFGPVALNGNTLVAGANSVADVFVQSGTTWTRTAQLVDPVPPQVDFFASRSVAISGNTILVGAPYRTIGSNTYQGAAYVFIQPVVTFSGSPQQPLTTDGSGNFVAEVTITNTGNITVSSVQLISATLGSGSLVTAPAAIANLAPGASAVMTLTFPSNSAPSGATSAPLKLSGTYSVTSPALGGNWALSFRSVTL